MSIDLPFRRRADWQQRASPRGCHLGCHTIGHDTRRFGPLLAQLAQLAVTNTAAHVVSRIKAAKTGKQHEQQINELTELINEMVDERNQLISIARAFEQELVAQRISPEEITYITQTLLPAVEELIRKGAGDDDAAEMIDPIKSVLSAEMLTVLQLIGFNYKQAIGEPLTALVQNLILSQVQQADVRAQLEVLSAQTNVLALQVAQDPDATRRLRDLS